MKRPITAAFDEQGRLYVSESSGTNDPVRKQLEDRPHRILRLEDRNGDGRFDASTLFADHLMFPEGTMWKDGSLYVSAPPQIWKITDDNDDGVADRREVWHDGQTLTGCANDLHGPYSAPDGWIYWTKGAFAEQSYPREGKPPFVTRASHIFRARPDGSGLEPVMTGGMDNPVDVAFTPSGERVFTTTFLVHPGAGQRDGLIHAIYGGLYGKVHDPIFSHIWTGPEVMPVLTHFGPAAPSGLLLTESDALGPDSQGQLLACQFNLHKVSRHNLITDGSTYRSEDSDFLVAESFDFHPTDVVEDADGSILILDTGGWYKLCCPTSQLHKPDVLGAIYRVRRNNAPHIDDPRGLRLEWKHQSAEELTDRLGDPRPPVRSRAIDELSRIGEPAVDAVRRKSAAHPAAQTRLASLWVLTRIHSQTARNAVRDHLADSDPTIRQAALNSISLWRDKESREALIPLLDASSLTERRLAAEAMGRIGEAQSVPALIQAAEAQGIDRSLEHALIYALIEIADRTATAQALTSKSPTARRVAIISLDQMPEGRLTLDQLRPSLSAADPAEQAAALWIASRHPEWGSSMAPIVRQWIDQQELTEALRSRILPFLRSADVQAVVADLAADSDLATEKRIFALQCLGHSGLKQGPPEWAAAVRQALDPAEPKLAAAALAVVSTLDWTEPEADSLTQAIRQFARSDRLGRDIVVQALAALPQRDLPVEPQAFEALLASLSPDEPVSLRSQAAQALSRASLSVPQLEELAKAIGQCSSLELGTLLPTFAKITAPSVGVRLIDSLAASPARPNLRPDDLRPILDGFGAPLAPAAAQLLEQMTRDRSHQAERLESLLTQLQSGDVRRGQEVFHSSRAACSSCHAMGYLGGRLGPDLTRIGQIRSERDLLEAIVYPSASFVRSYEPVLVATTDGRVLNGLLRAETADEVVLAIDATQQVRIPRQQIDEMKPGEVSIMPAGLDQQLTPQQLADLVAFLRSAK